MRLFISWSGKTSYDVACALRDWLPLVVQAVKPFVSAGDIDKGKRWSDELAKELGEASYGIVCLTSSNIHSPWINFESGAISTALLRTSSVTPFLFDNLEMNRIGGPLQQFQATRNDREDILSLVFSINNRLEGEERLSPELLQHEFEIWWPDLEKKFAKIAGSQGGESESGFPWLYTRSELLHIQSNPTCKEIWLVTSKLYQHALAREVDDALQRNIERGVAYTFIINATQGAELAGALNDFVKKYSTRLHIQHIPDDEFRRNAATDYLFLNPETGARRVLFEIPVKTRGYWIEVDDEAAISFTDRFRALATRK